MEGWIKLHRKILESDLWNSKEPFGVRDAWIDLLLLANHADRKILFDGDPYIVKRGQHVTSIRKLSERWHWGIKKTSKYLKVLESEKMIALKISKRGTHLTILNYAKYQGLEDIEGTQMDTQEDTQRKHQRTHTTPPNKNEKNVKNEKKYMGKPSTFMSGEESTDLKEFIKMMEDKNDTKRSD